jgi:hypothetical protein
VEIPGKKSAEKGQKIFSWSLFYETASAEIYSAGVVTHDSRNCLQPWFTYPPPHTQYTYVHIYRNIYVYTNLFLKVVTQLFPHSCSGGSMTKISLGVTPPRNCIKISIDCWQDRYSSFAPSSCRSSTEAQDLGDRCYDHNLRRKIGVFLKNQCYDQLFA